MRSRAIESSDIIASPANQLYPMQKSFKTEGFKACCVLDSDQLLATDHYLNSFLSP
jgi:hypothetical protein